MSDPILLFTQENLDDYLCELAKEYRRLAGKKMSADIILVGGAAIVARYSFRESTMDIDAVINAASSMKDAINRVGDRHNLPNGWINSDFAFTASFSDKLASCSSYYRTFSNVVTVRIVGAEYLVAMKLRSGRQYKHDLSDIAGILWEHEKAGDPLTEARIKTAYEFLYGDWMSVSDVVRTFLDNILSSGNYEAIYYSVAKEEKETRDSLIRFAREHPGVVATDNVGEVLAALTERAEQDGP